MDTVSAYSRKAQFLQNDFFKPIIKSLQNTIHIKILGNQEAKQLPRAVEFSLTFELSYLLIRHRTWQTTELLSELAIDFLASEYRLTQTAATQIVEAAIDVLHRYSLKDGDGNNFNLEEEFLEHLIIASLISADEDTLAIDLGLGKNFLDLLKNALDLESGPEAFHFAPELTQKLSFIMQRIFDEIEIEPATMDLYRLKNLLQRDDSTPKDRWQKEHLKSLNAILASCWPEGKSEKQLTDELSQAPELFASHLRLLLRNGLIYEEPRGPKRSSLYRLSHRGYELTCTQFAFDHWQSLGQAIHLRHLPSAYQSTLLQILARQSLEQLQELIESEGQYLSPIALRYIVEHLKQEGQEEGLLAIFVNLLHNQAHAWIRVEICQALPLPGGLTLSSEWLDPLLNEDPSPMVRSAARAAVQRTRRLNAVSERRSEGV